MSSIHILFNSVPHETSTKEPNEAGIELESASEAEFIADLIPATGDAESEPALIVRATISTDDEEVADLTDTDAPVADDPLADAVEAWTGITSTLSRPQPADSEPSLPPQQTKAAAPGFPSAVIDTQKPTEARPISDFQFSPADSSLIADPEPLTPAQTAGIVQSNAIREPVANAFQTRASAPPPPVQQVIEAMTRVAGDHLEIALSPEDLGALRLVVSRSNGLPHIHIWTERPDVLELIRRSSDLLNEHFSENGASPSFSFSSGAEGNADNLPGSGRSGTEAGISEIATVSVALAQAPRTVSNQRIDIRV